MLADVEFCSFCFGSPLRFCFYTDAVSRGMSQAILKTRHWVDEFEKFVRIPRLVALGFFIFAYYLAEGNERWRRKFVGRSRRLVVRWKSFIGAETPVLKYWCEQTHKKRDRLTVNIDLVSLSKLSCLVATNTSPLLHTWPVQRIAVYLTCSNKWRQYQWEQHQK